MKLSIKTDLKSVQNRSKSEMNVDNNSIKKVY